MNTNQLTQVLIDILQETTAAAKSGGAWVADQAPDVARQFIAAELMVSAVWLLASGLVLGLVIVAMRRLSKAMQSENWDQRETAQFASIPLAFIGVVAFVVVFISAGSAAKCVVAPKVVIIEKAASLIKGE